ncbi:MAG TPA: hypothetical protein VHN77_11980 [Phycisphaerales bacterium]|nr:hypothetical protein [Phycisphaerales bacterium]
MNTDSAAVRLRPWPRRSLALIGVVFVVALLARTAAAQPILVDFELLPGMGNTPGASIPAASRLGDQYLATHGVRFSSGSAFVGVVIHGAGTPSGTRIIGGSTAAGQLTYNQQFPITARFLDATGAEPRIVSTVSVRGDLQPIPGTKTLEAFDLGGAMIGSQTLQDSNTAPLSITTPGIHSVRFFSSSATIGFDDLRFDTPVAPVTCDTIDFNGDTLFPDTQDIADFLTVFAGGACPTGVCGDIDFNNDGLFPDTDDIAALIRVFGGGACL